MAYSWNNHYHDYAILATKAKFKHIDLYKVIVEDDNESAFLNLEIISLRIFLTLTLSPPNYSI